MKKLRPDIIPKIMYMLQNRLLVAVMEAINLERGNWSVTKWNNRTILIKLMVGFHKYFRMLTKQSSNLFFYWFKRYFLPLNNYFLVIFPFKCSEFLENLFYICYHGYFWILGYFWIISLKDVKILLYFGNEFCKMKSKIYLTKIRTINFESDFELLE